MTITMGCCATLQNLTSRLMCITSLLVLCAYTEIGLCKDDVYISYEIIEEQPNKTFMGNVISDGNLYSHYDLNASVKFRFFILNSNIRTGYFEIEETSGLLRTSKSIDREDVCPGSMDCVINMDIAVKPMSEFYIIHLLIKVSDINDNKPVFPRDVILLEVSESISPGVIFTIPNAVDLDEKQYGVQRYAMKTPSETFYLRVSETSDYFDSQTIHLVLNDDLDREATDFYSLVVMACDGGIPAHSGSVTIQITILDTNDNSPTFDMQTYNVNIMENVSVGRSVIRVHAQDPDLGKNGEITYIWSKKSLVEYGDMFGVGSQTGYVVVNKELDYEADRRYTLDLEARDNGDTTLTATAKVVITIRDVNDHAPVITVTALTSSGQLEVRETDDVGTFIAHISVYDPDQGMSGEVTCGVDNMSFRLEHVYGAYKLVSNSVFDREICDVYTVIVTCRDQGERGRHSITVIKIHVLDINDHHPQFTQDKYQVVIPENNQINLDLLTVRATDKDAGVNSQVHYKVYDVNGFPTEMICMNALTGVIHTNVVLDYEDESEYKFIVVASDGGVISLSSTAIFTIHLTNVNDEVPTFPGNRPYSFRVMENSAAGSEVGRVTATDLDDPPYDVIRYYIDPASQHGHLFHIDRKTGVMTSRVTLDREVVAQCNMVVCAVNPGSHLPNTVHEAVISHSCLNIVPLPATLAQHSTSNGSMSVVSWVQVTVSVLDVNDNGPVVYFPSPLRHQVSVPHDVEHGAVITSVNATDADTGLNARLTYHIFSGDGNHLFAMDSNHGSISVMEDLSSHRGEVFVLHIAVEDGGDPAFTVEAMLSVHILSSGSMSVLLDDHTFIIVILAVTMVVVTLTLTSSLIAVLIQRRRDQRLHSDQYNYHHDTRHTATPPDLTCVITPTPPDLTHVTTPCVGLEPSHHKTPSSIKDVDIVNMDHYITGRTRASWSIPANPLVVVKVSI